MEKLLGDLADTVFIGLAALVCLGLVVGRAVIAWHALSRRDRQPPPWQGRPEAGEADTWPPPPKRPAP